MSRRPGEVRETVNIEKALKERDLRNIELEKYLWDLLKEEAVAAEREIGSET